MYCPKCAQEQISDDAKFCTRCGLPLNGLAEWLAAGGNVSAEHQHNAATLTVSRRRKRIRQGAKLMFLGGVLLPIFFVLSLAVEEPGFLIIPLIEGVAKRVWPRNVTSCFAQSVGQLRQASGGNRRDETTAQRHRAHHAPAEQRSTVNPATHRN